MLCPSSCLVSASSFRDWPLEPWNLLKCIVSRRSSLHALKRAFIRFLGVGVHIGGTENSGCRYASYSVDSYIAQSSSDKTVMRPYRGEGDHTLCRTTYAVRCCCISSILVAAHAMDHECGGGGHLGCDIPRAMRSLERPCPTSKQPAIAFRKSAATSFSGGACTQC